MPEYELLGITLPSGSWANWFAGFASTAAVVVALSAHWFAERRRKAEEEKESKDHAMQVGWKVLGILNHNHDIYRHFWVAADPRFVGIHGRVERWRSTFPLIGIEVDPGLALNESQIGFLLRSQQADLLMQIHLAFARYQSLVRSVHEYQTIYETMRDSAPAPSSISEGVMSQELTREEAFSMMPRVTTMEGLIESIRESSLENVKDSSSALENYNAAMKSVFGKQLLEFGHNESLGTRESLGEEIPRTSDQKKA